MNGLIWIEILILSLVCSCSTTDPVVETSGVELKKEILSLPKCPATNIRCTHQLSPTMCSSLEYEGKLFHERYAPKAFGLNPCWAKAKLSQNACKFKLRPELFKRVSCVPDGTGGVCPIKPTMCTQDYAPSVCEAQKYADQPLEKDMILRGWGSNECQARQALLGLACNMNLKPTLLGGIVCLEDKTKGQCPPKPADCPVKTGKSECVASGLGETDLEEPLVAKAENECMAKYELKLMACHRDISPEQLTKIECEKL